jgi:hypothetical protein
MACCTRFSFSSSSNAVRMAVNSSVTNLYGSTLFTSNFSRITELAIEKVFCSGYIVG